MSASGPPSERDVYTVTRLNREVGRLLSGEFPLIWLEGELSNLARPGSGHLYFSLKDEGAQVRAAMFRNRNMYLRFRPENGAQVLVRGRVGLYEPRGDYQLIVEHMEEAGHGALQRAYEALKKRLHEEGLFDPDRKRPLPMFPRRLGVITSPTGAAIRDVLSVLGRRCPGLPVLIYPIPVQGADAPAEIVRTLKLSAERAECDVLLLTRGGGSLEDLQAFNDEAVARAVAGSPIPIVCGVGHEIDVTIADFAADVRAPTPSAAAELIAPDSAALIQRLRHVRARLHRLTAERVGVVRERLAFLRHRLQRLHPRRRLEQQGQRLDELELRLRRAVTRRLEHSAARLAHADAGLHGQSPRHRLARLSLRLHHVRPGILGRAMLRTLSAKQTRLEALARHLDTVSPLATLRRGYAIVTPAGSNRPLMKASAVSGGDALDVRLAEGELRVIVES